MTDSGQAGDFETDAGHVAALVRERDRDGYLCALFAPGGRRDALLALLAFNSEIVRARAGVSEVVIGHMRMKWWYDSLAGVFAAAPPHHPVARALAGAVPLGLDRSALEAIIEAHAEAVGGEIDRGADALMRRADAELGPLFRQFLDLLDARGPDSDRAVAAAARAWGLLSAMRRASVHPDDVRGVHAAASDQRRQAGRPRGAGLPALLPMVLTDIYLGRIARAGFDLGHPLVRRADPGAWALPKLWWAARRG